MSAEGMAGTTAGHNSAARASTIRDIIDQRRKIEGQIAELMVVRKKNQGRIKSDLGMKVADFNALYRIAELETEDRDQFIDTLREGFAALGIGQQSSFLSAMGMADQPAPEPEKPAKAPKLTVHDAYGAGAQSFRLGEAEGAFPESMSSKALKENFLKGWADAKVSAQIDADREEFGEREPDPVADEGDEPEDE